MVLREIKATTPGLFVWTLAEAWTLQPTGGQYCRVVTQVEWGVSHGLQQEGAIQMKSVLKLLGLSPNEEAADTSGETETVRKIVKQLDLLPVEEARYTAAFAYILGRVAHADLKISDEETQAMEDILVAQGSLSRDQAVLVVQMAKSQNRLFGGTEDYLVTREFNKIASRQQKLNLLRCLFAVSASDESVSVREDNAIRQISKELLLEHSDFIRCRRAFREHLAFLKRDEDPEKSGD